MKQTSKDKITKWSSFKRGLNTLVSANKIRPDELSLANNVVLVGEGSPQRRSGTATYGNNSSGAIHTGLMPYYKSDGTHELIKVENGILKKLNTSTSNWDLITGVSFASTAHNRYSMTNDVLYISNGTDALTKYNGTGSQRFTAIATPSGLAVSRGASLASGQSTVSYRISATNDIGETLASTAVTAQVNRARDEWNFDPTTPDANYSTLLTWTATSGATGYNIYGVESGFETYLDSVPGALVTSYRDYGLTIPSNLFTPPAGNTTDAPKGKYIKSFKSALLIAGDPAQPSRLYYSAGVDKPESFLISDGGGFIDVNKNSEDGVISGIGIYQNQAIIFKERSTWQFNFTESAFPTLFNLNLGVGCISHDTIVPVENDLFFLGRKSGAGAAIYVLGNEPQFLNILRTNELSARVRPDLQGLISENYEKAAAFYIDGKYVLSYLEGTGTGNNRAIVYDRERLGFTKWRDIAINYPLVYYTANGEEKILYVDHTDQRVSEMGSAYTTDKGTPISWEYITREEDDDQPFNFKKRYWVNFGFQNVGGTNTLSIYTDDTATSFSLHLSTQSLQTALRASRLRVGRLRITEGGGVGDVENVIAKRIPFHRMGAVAVNKRIKFGVSGSTSTSKATLLDLTFESRAKSRHYFELDEVVQI